MPRNGHLTKLAHGTDLPAQVGYRLAGIDPGRSLSRRAQEAQVDYRLGEGRVDSRQVWFLGSGATAAQLDYRPGEQMTAADGAIVRAAMFGIDRRTGLRVRINEERNRHARIAAAPFCSVLTEACEQAGIEPASLWASRNPAAQWRAVANAAARSNGTVAFRSVATLLRSIEFAWESYEIAVGKGQTPDPPPIRIDRNEVLRRLGAHHRALHEAGSPQLLDGVELDLTLDDHAIGTLVWEHTAEDAARMVPIGNAGYELTATCPKSFSVAAFLDAPERREEWMATVRDAVTDATDELMRRVAHGRTGHEGDGQQATPIRGDGYAATVSIESYSRELDPHLHAHVMIPNRVVCVDGVERTMATGGSDLVNHAWWFQAEFERRLRALSVERGLVTGWQFDVGNWQWEVAGADPEIMAFYSQAQALVRAATVEDLEGDGLAVTTDRIRLLDSRAKRRVTQSKSEETLTWDEVRHRMLARAYAGGVDVRTAFDLPDTRADWQRPETWNAQDWAWIVDQLVCENKGAEITARIEAAVRALAPHEWDEQQIADTMRTVIKRAFTTGTARTRGRVGTLTHASNRVLLAEQRASEAFTAGFDANTHRLTPTQAEVALARWREESGWAAAGRDFTPGQRALFEQMTSGMDRVSVVVGPAGSGKTTAVDAARHALALHGQRVYGVTVAAIAAQQLRGAANVEAGTVSWLVQRITVERDPDHPIRTQIAELERSRRGDQRARAEHMRRRFAIPAMDHLVIDEASMIPATDLATVLDWAAKRDVTVTLIGDHKQLQPVGPTGLFAQFRAARPGAELTENLRQRTDLGRECAAFLRDGDAESALTLLADAGQLVVVSSQTEAERVLVHAWADRAARATTTAERITTVAIESDRNDQVDILNHHARTEARQRGWVTGPDTTYNARGRSATFAEGDQILITKNINRRNAPALANGTRGVVTAVHADRVELTHWTSGGPMHESITAKQAATHARLGYAMTTHKLQGQTVDSLVVDVGPDRDLASAYVALTRHRDEVIAVVNAADIADGAWAEHLVRATPEARRDAVVTMVAERIQRRGFSTQLTAHDSAGMHLPIDTPSPGMGTSM
jgi:conjugative relaxase-like TrwC/TraI family protein